MGSWSTSSSSTILSHGAGSFDGTRGWSAGHACQRSCRCNSGGCRCSGGCRSVSPGSALGWSVPAPPPVGSFDDAGVRGELRGGRRSIGMARPAHGGGDRWRAGSGRRGSPGRARQQASFAHRRQRVVQLMRKARANAAWSRRLGWGRHASRIARALGSVTTNPYSPRLAAAIARWQRRLGLPATGVLAPRDWYILRRRLQLVPAWPSAEPVPVGATEPMQQDPTFPDPSLPDASTPTDPPPGSDGVDEPAGAASFASDSGDPSEPPPEGTAAGGDGAEEPTEEWYELAWATP